MQSDGVPVNDPLGGGRSSATLGNRSGPSGGRAAALKQSLGPSGPMTPQVAMPCPPKSKKSGAACRAQRQTPACVSPCKPRCLKPPRIRCGSIRIPKEPWNTESYDRIYENEFLAAIDNPLSTFSVDVDAASYSNTRRYLENGVLPPPDAVRIEEFINYFSYDYPEPGDGHPFSITADVSSCPWNPEHRLVHIGLKGREIFVEDAPPSNLVFLLDVSGSMAPQNKLPLVKRGLKLLVQNLRAKDRIAIVVYASSAGLHLRSTPGDEKEKLLDAILQLHACGSTAGGAGIELAYKIAQKNFIEEGNNRVILTTDGDFNTGPSSDSYIVRLIEEKRKSGV
ncbi:MAG: von Willebrand factor type A domain-containing protein, partial [Candidatus Latescibacterota bacterium]